MVGKVGMTGEDRIIRRGVHEDNQSLPLPGTIKDARELPANRSHLAPSQNNISAAATAAAVPIATCTLDVVRKLGLGHCVTDLRPNSSRDVTCM